MWNDRIEGGNRPYGSMVVGDCTTFKNGKQPGNGRPEWYKPNKTEQISIEYATQQQLHIHYSQMHIKCSPV